MDLQNRKPAAEEKTKAILASNAGKSVKMLVLKLNSFFSVTTDGEKTSI